MIEAQCDRNFKTKLLYKPDRAACGLKPKGKLKSSIIPPFPSDFCSTTMNIQLPLEYMKAV